MATTVQQQCQPNDAYTGNVQVASGDDNVCYPTSRLQLFIGLDRIDTLSGWQRYDTMPCPPRAKSVEKS